MVSSRVAWTLAATLACTGGASAFALHAPADRSGSSRTIPPFDSTPLIATDVISSISFQFQASSVGHPPSAPELAAIDIDVLPDGHGLPPGKGTAEQGKAIYAAHCASCHGPTGREGPNDILAGGQGSLATALPLKTVGSYWPYATTLWDYINRAMPFERPHSLSADEVYSVTAYVLWLNGIVGERDELTAATLPKVPMPNRTGFVDDTRSNEDRPR